MMFNLKGWNTEMRKFSFIEEINRRVVQAKCTQADLIRGPQGLLFLWSFQFFKTLTRLNNTVTKKSDSPHSDRRDKVINKKDLSELC